MRWLTTFLAVSAVAFLPRMAMAQVPTEKKELVLLQLYEDTLRARQNAEIELASCKVQAKDLQQQLQAAQSEKKQEPKK